MWQSASVFVSSVAHNDESKLKWCYTCLSFRTSQFIRSFISDHIALHREHTHPGSSTTNAILFRNHLLLLVCVLYVNVSMKTLHSLRFSRCDSMVSIAFAPNYCSVVCSTMPFNWNLDKEQRKRKLMPAFLCCCSWFSVFHSMIFVAFGCLCFCARRSQLNDNVAFEIALNWNCVVELRHFRKLSLISDGLLLSLSFT